MNGETWWVVVEIPAEKQAIYGDFLFDAVAEAADGVTDHRDGWDPSIWAGSDPTAELRARVEKAEARAWEIANAARLAGQEHEALRDGIQALADEWEAEHAHGTSNGATIVCGACHWDGLKTAALRGLLSPTTEGPTT